MINIANLLKGAPEGMPLYSPLFGNVEFSEVCIGNDMPIRIKRGYAVELFDEYGRYYKGFPDAECLLFPSKGHTWQEWTPCVEPQYKVHDCVVSNGQPAIIYELKKDYYLGKYLNGHDFCHKYTDEDKLHLWSIEDAEDGDVLMTTSIRNCPFIYRKTNHNNNLAYYYAGIDGNGNFCEGCLKRTLFHFGSVSNVMPATKEQRVLLFKKMQEAGYQWYAGKKELRKIIEPKFKVGDWITDGNITIQIEDVRNDCYTYSDGVLYSTRTADKVYHLWTLADIKYGDVLTNTAGCILIAKDNESCLCYIDKNGEFHANNNKWFFANFSDNALMPATKEQRKLLFHKMKESGYELNEKKKGLHKIIEPKFNIGDKVIYKGKVRTITRIVENYYEFDGWSASCRIEKQDELLSPAPKPHYDIANFQPFDKVLVRCSNDERWMIEFYCKYDTLVHTSPHRDYPFMGIGDSYSQCIPFEGNEHLLGTTDTPPDEYINW